MGNRNKNFVFFPSGFSNFLRLTILRVSKNAFIEIVEAIFLSSGERGKNVSWDALCKPLHSQGSINFCGLGFYKKAFANRGFELKPSQSAVLRRPRRLWPRKMWRVNPGCFAILGI